MRNHLGNGPQFRYLVEVCQSRSSPTKVPVDPFTVGTAVRNEAWLGGVKVSQVEVKVSYVKVKVSQGIEVCQKLLLTLSRLALAL